MSGSSDGDIGEFFEPEEDEEPMGPADPAEGYEESELAPETPHSPVPEAPEVGSDAVRDYEDVDPALRRRFWGLVLAIKFTIIALTLGSLLVVFEGNLSLGGRVLVAAAVLSGYSVYRYRLVRDFLDANDESEEDEEGEVKP